jgi:DNA-binding NtrC family response regulator
VGETGTGKELVARLIHAASGLPGPIVAVAAQDLTPTLYESLLFGHAKGSFTGATRDHEGYVQQAARGTLFLDEAQDLILPVQGALLRVMEGHPFRPLGGTREVRPDVRLVVASQRRIGELVHEKKLRRDFAARLGYEEFRLPPLRERLEDLEALCGYMLGRWQATEQGPLALSPQTLELLKRHPWPDNVRQLQRCLEYAAYRAQRVVEPRHLPPRFFEELCSAETDAGPRIGSRRERARWALLGAGGNRANAAAAAGVSERTLRRWIREDGPRSS